MSRLVACLGFSCYRHTATFLTKMAAWLSTPIMVQVEGPGTGDLWSGHDGHAQGGEPITAAMEVRPHRQVAFGIRWCDADQYWHFNQISGICIQDPSRPLIDKNTRSSLFRFTRTFVYIEICVQDTCQSDFGALSPIRWCRWCYWSLTFPTYN